MLEASRSRHLITPAEVAALIPGMTLQKLAHLRFQGQGPAYFKPTPKTVVYDEAIVLEWLEGTMRSIT